MIVIYCVIQMVFSIDCNSLDLYFVFVDYYFL